MNKVYPVAFVVWEDHSHDSDSWTPIEDLKTDDDDAYLVRTVGFVTHEDVNAIYVAFNLDTGLCDGIPKITHRMRIIKSCIRYMKVIASSNLNLTLVDDAQTE